MPDVYVKFPKTGLGNMLLVWAKGVVFASDNNLSCYTSQWWGLRWGALLRGEKKKRFYIGYFIETPLCKQWLFKWRCLFGNTIQEPPEDFFVNNIAEKKTVILFDKVITDNDLFGRIRNHHVLIKEALYKILTYRIKQNLDKYPSPEIGIHIRRGDFLIGYQTTPIQYFINGIHLIRTTVGKPVPVTVFTDADEQDLKDVMMLSNITIAESKPDILDILLLSKSKIMILSKSSTFSYWGAYLSNAVVIRPANDWQAKIRNDQGEGLYREFKWDDTVADATLVNAILNIPFQNR